MADLETLAASTQILTSRPEELTVENVTAAAQIVNTLLLSPNATEVQTLSAKVKRRLLRGIQATKTVPTERLETATDESHHETASTLCLAVTVMLCPVFIFVLQSVRVAAVATVSQLLNTSVPDNTEENDATLRCNIYHCPSIKTTQSNISVLSEYV